MLWIGLEIGGKRRGEDGLLPAGLGEEMGVHAAHCAHADEANGGLFVSWSVWGDIWANHGMKESA
jgi:hypothetical protein